MAERVDKIGAKIEELAAKAKSLFKHGDGE